MKNIKQHIKEKLKRAKIPFRFYARNPVPDLDFVISTDSQRKKLLIHVDNKCRAEVYTSEKHKQAVLCITQPKRTLERKHTIAWHTVKYDDKKGNAKYWWDYYAGIDLPPRTRYSCRRDGRQVYIKAIIPATTIYLLVGQDESHMFVCRLPKAVASVRQAHEVLIPKEAKGKDYLRQGEFFFVKATDKEISNKLTKDLRLLDIEGRLDLDYKFKESEQPSSHIAERAIIGSESNGYNLYFVTGKITHSRHKTLNLEGLWHVYINTEIENTNTKYID